MAEEYVYRMRPHHGLCLAFFVGEGYSGGFVENMRKITRRLEENPQILITCTDDSICAACPNNVNGVCLSEDKVRGYDSKVLALCGVSEGEILPFHTFRDRVYRNILSKGKREEVCADCQWSSLCRSVEEKRAD